MKYLTLVSFLIVSALPIPSTYAAEGDWVVRIRATSISPHESSHLGSTVNKAVGANVMTPSADLKVDSNTIPELDISYYWTQHIATELILALGSKHDVTITGDSAGVIGNQPLGSIDALPPILTLQWHFNPDQTVDPYVGAGFNATWMLDRNLRFTSGATSGEKIKIERNSFGPALQAGVDFNLKDGWLLNADVKYVWIETDVEMKSVTTGNRWAKIDTLDIHPWVISLGIGKRF